MCCAPSARRTANAQVILMTGAATVDTAIEAVKAGALDYLSKPFDFERLGSLLRGVKEAREDREVLLSADADGRRAARLPRDDRPQPRHAGAVPIGAAAGAARADRAGHRRNRHRQGAGRQGAVTRGPARATSAFSPSTARRSSRRCSKASSSATCAARSPARTESKVGLFEHAHGGTLFLDEVGELPLPLQPKLLRAVEYGEVQRVGSLETRKLDVSVVAATNRICGPTSTAGRFRSDLFYRLSILEIHIPPLRERREDIPYLAAAFIREIRRTLRSTDHRPHPCSRKAIAAGDVARQHPRAAECRSSARA